MVCEPHMGLMEKLSRGNSYQLMYNLNPTKSIVGDNALSNTAYIKKNFVGYNAILEASTNSLTNSYATALDNIEDKLSYRPESNKKNPNYITLDDAIEEIANKYTNQDTNKETDEIEDKAYNTNSHDTTSTAATYNLVLDSGSASNQESDTNNSDYITLDDITLDVSVDVPADYTVSTKTDNASELNPSEYKQLPTIYVSLDFDTEAYGVATDTTNSQSQNNQSEAVSAVIAKDDLAKLIAQELSLTQDTKQVDANVNLLYNH